MEDLIGLVQSDDLTEVVLAAHNFGEVPIAGVADRIPERIAQLVYFDAVVLVCGMNPSPIYPPQEAAATEV